LVISALGGVVVLCGGGIRSACRASSRMQERATVRGAYLVKRGWRGSRGRASGRGLGCGVGLAVVVASSLQNLVWRVCISSMRT